MLIDILLTVHNGARFLPEQLESLQAQTCRDWRLWVRDDASSDDSAAVVRRFAASDERIQLLASDHQRLGVGRGFNWLLERRLGQAPYTMFCDADDYWLPNKIELTLAAMRRAEAEAGSETPILVHTDLTIANAQLEPIAESMWRYQGTDPERVNLRRLLVRNTVTGPSVMINRALAQLAAPIPTEAWSQDWWMALVACCFGRIVPLWTPTLLYRQHEGNRSGARRFSDSVDVVLRKALTAFQRADALREAIRCTTRQAEALLYRYGDRLDPESLRLLRRYAEIPRCGPVRRKLRVLQLRTLAEFGLVRNIGLVLRA